MVTWGVAQGLVKKYIGEVPPARFCLFYALANAVVSLAFSVVKDREGNVLGAMATAREFTADKVQ